ncbi:MAG: DEAD/DEAH box helicase [Deltaproteobacteria bacterium]|nr:MAG: DEAD/DEAH box helicase [Deltaproteobacteria bacterium]
MTARIRFDGGTVVLEDAPEHVRPDSFVYDGRIGHYRAQAIHYADAVLRMHRAKVPYVDEARAYDVLDRPHRSNRSPRDYQAEAVQAWRASGRRATVVLPTGAGKSFVAEMCIADANRSALVVAPTIDLVGQWYDGLRRAFGEPVGVLGGGVHEVHPITVATYDSAWMHIHRYGARFGLIVYDEVHHLPGPSFAQSAECAIAPFRLGLTATLERPDGSHARIDDLVGPVCYRKEITDLAGDFLAPYRTELVAIPLSDADRGAYEENRHIYRSFVESRAIRVGSRGGWSHFLREAARSKDGRRALLAWRESRRILQGAPAKLRMLEELLRRHRDGRVVVFTNDNATVYDISRRLLLPAITHQTDAKERRALLDAFTDGSLPVLVTSRVLNEGVDIPSADVAVVLSGTGTVREHVQRLGRILRPQEGKQAVLYELVVEGTSEEVTSARRRDHVAYS